MAGSSQSDTLRLKGPHCGQRCSHKCWLRILRKRQRLLFTIPDERAQIFAKGLINLIKNRFSRRISLGQCPAHANGLGALSGKYKCSGHNGPPCRFNSDTVPCRFWQPLTAPTHNCCAATESLQQLHLQGNILRLALWTLTATFLDPRTPECPYQTHMPALGRLPNSSTG